MDPNDINGIDKRSQQNNLFTSSVEKYSNFIQNLSRNKNSVNNIPYNSKVRHRNTMQNNGNFIHAAEVNSYHPPNIRNQLQGISKRKRSKNSKNKIKSSSNQNKRLKKGKNYPDRNQSESQRSSNILDMEIEEENMDHNLHNHLQFGN